MKGQDKEKSAKTKSVRRRQLQDRDDALECKRLPLLSRLVALVHLARISKLTPSHYPGCYAELLIDTICHIPFLI